MVQQLPTELKALSSVASTGDTKTKLRIIRKITGRELRTNIMSMVKKKLVSGRLKIFFLNWEI